MPSLVDLSPRLSDENDLFSSSCSYIDISIIKDRLGTMRKLEEQTSYNCHDYFQTTSSSNHESSTSSTSSCATTYHLLRRRQQQQQLLLPADEECRRKMCQWCYRIVDHFDTSRDTVALAMSFLDRFLCTDEGQSSILDRNLYQLTSMTTLFMADKLHNSRHISPSFLARLSKGSYTKEQIINRERDILHALRWKLSKPTPLNFLHHFIALLRGEEEEKVVIMKNNNNNNSNMSVIEDIEEIARFQIEIIIMEYKFSFIDSSSSSIAFASILNALTYIDEDRLSSHVKDEYIRLLKYYCSERLEENLTDILSWLINLQTKRDNETSSCHETTTASSSSSSPNDTSYNNLSTRKLCICTNNIKRHGASPVSIIRRGVVVVGGEPDDSPILAGEAVLTS